MSPLRLPARSPNLNSHAERWVKLVIAGGPVNHYAASQIPKGSFRQVAWVECFPLRIAEETLGVVHAQTIPAAPSAKPALGLSLSAIDTASQVSYQAMELPSEKQDHGRPQSAPGPAL